MLDSAELLPGATLFPSEGILEFYEKNAAASWRFWGGFGIAFIVRD
jgi:hypothetical protein